MSYDTIIVEIKEHGIVQVTLNRPEMLNAMNGTMFKELTMAFEEMSQDGEVAVVILKGAGRAFSAGRDIKAKQDFLEGVGRLKGINTLIEKLGAPVIAAVNGYAMKQ